MVSAWISLLVREQLWLSYQVLQDLVLAFAVLPGDNEVEPNPDPDDDSRKLPGDGADGGIPSRFLAPFFVGWQREVVLRRISTNRRNVYDGYYVPPQSGQTSSERKKPRSMNAKALYLATFPSRDLSIENFCYKQGLQIGKKSGAPEFRNRSMTHLNSDRR